MRHVRCPGCLLVPMENVRIPLGAGHSGMQTSLGIHRLGIGPCLAVSHYPNVGGTCMAPLVPSARSHYGSLAVDDVAGPSQVVAVECRYHAAPETP